MKLTSGPLVYLLAALAALVTGALVSVAGRDRSAAERVATVYQAARPIPALGLTDHTGAPFDAAGLDGQWAWLFFGFTHCPDVCPLTLQTLARAYALIRDENKKPRVYLISVDPDRDDPATLGRYVSHFDPSFRGVTGSNEQIRALAEALYVAVVRVPLADGGYTVDHSAAVFLVNPAAEVTAVTTPPHGARALASDYLAIRRGAR